MTDRSNLNGKSGIVDRGELDKGVTKWLRQRPMNENGTMTAKSRNIYISGNMRDRIKLPTANLGFSIDVLGANLAILDCLTLSQTFSCTFIELVVVKNPDFAIRISTLSVIVPEIQLFPVLAVISLFPVVCRCIRGFPEKAALYVRAVKLRLLLVIRWRALSLRSLITTVRMDFTSGLWRVRLSARHGAR